MHAHGAEFIVFCARHESLAQTLINNENDFGRDLRAQKPCFFRAGILPLGEVLGHLGALDAGGGLRVPVSAAAAACAGVLLLQENCVGGRISGLLLLLVILL